MTGKPGPRQWSLETARFAVRCETYLVARAFELLRERARVEPARWAFVGLPPATQMEWKVVEGMSLQLG